MINFAASLIIAIIYAFVVVIILGGVAVLVALVCLPFVLAWRFFFGKSS